MLTYVVIGAQFAFAIAHYQDALSSYFNNQTVTNVREFICAAYKVPTLRKDFVHFVCKYIGRNVLIASETLTKSLDAAVVIYHFRPTGTSS